MNTINIIPAERIFCNRPTPQRRPARVALSLLLAVFIVSTAVVYVISPSATNRPQPFSATATVVLPELSPDGDSLQEIILSDANLARAVSLLTAADKGSRPAAQSSSLVARPLEEVRRQLSVKTSEITVLKAAVDSEPGKAEVSITYSGPADAAQACRLVDLLADQAASQDTDRRRTAAELVHKKAKQAADDARAKLIRAQAEYDAFLHLHFAAKNAATSTTSDTGQAAANSAAPDAAEQPGPLPPGPLPPGSLPLGDEFSRPTPSLRFDRPDWTDLPRATTLANPRWSQLNNKLDSLKLRRSAMLERMTPAHPEVESIELEIADLQRKLSSTPRELPRPRRDSLPPIAPRPPNPTDDLLAPGGEGRRLNIISETETAQSQRLPEIIPPQGDGSPHNPAEEISIAADLKSQPAQPALAAEFRTKQKALASAQENYNRLAAAERRAWQTLEKIPAAEVIPSICPLTSPSLAAARQPWTIAVASLVGLICMAGVGMLSLGVSPPASFANAAEVRAVLKTPVVGTIPAVDQPGSDDFARRRTMNWAALGACVILFLIAAVAVYSLKFYSA